MSATKLILHHTYERGIAFDVSQHGNHGTPISVTGGTGAFSGGLRFNGGASQVNVRPLSDLRSIRVKIRFMHTPAHPGTRRHNLVEGHISFALFVNPNASLQATILDRNGTWTGVASAPGLIVPQRWYDVEFLHDGMSHVHLFADGTLVGERFDVPGPVRDIDQLGVSIGHWPGPDPRYTLEGWVDDLRIWCEDVDDAVRDLVDDCCIDRAALDRLVQRVRADGWDGDRLGKLMREIIDLGDEITIAARHGTPQRTAAAAQVVRDALLALAQRKRFALGQALNAFENLVKAGASPAQVASFGQRALGQLKASPLAPMLFGGSSGSGHDFAAELARIFCFDWAMPHGDRPPRHPHRPRPEGDPDTDGPVSAVPPEPADQPANEEHR